MSEPIIAWRVWEIGVDSYLYSWYMNHHRWIPGEVFSKGKQYIGIHAFKYAHNVIDYSIIRDCCGIIGKVALWGDIVEHELGYTAEFAYPYSLEFLIPSNWRALDLKSIENNLRNLYGCNVEDFCFSGTKSYDGTKLIFKDGLLHDNYLPSVIDKDGNKFWYQFGRMHRADGPAALDPNGNKAYWMDNKLHRMNGPAVIYTDGTEKYYEFGEEYFPNGINEIKCLKIS